MSSLEGLLNWLTDMDWGWWPFLRLRPPKHERLTTGHVALMSVAYGLFYGVLLGTLEAARGQVAWASVPVFPLTIGAIFFVAYRFTFAMAWNFRADRLARTKSVSS